MIDTDFAQEEALESGAWDPEEQSWADFAADAREDHDMHGADL